MTPSDFKAWRKALGLSQKKAADALGLKNRIVQYYEKGERDGEKVKIPKHVRLACYALSLGVERLSRARCGRRRRRRRWLASGRRKRKRPAGAGGRPRRRALSRPARLDTRRRGTTLLHERQRHHRPAPSADVAASSSGCATCPAHGRQDRAGRLIFALDATASREPTWDLACQRSGRDVPRGRPGRAASRSSSSSIAASANARSSTWVRDGRELVRLMRGVRCVAGKTQIARVLRHAASEARRTAVQALVFVGDCMEENVDELGRLAGELGLLGMRAFLFHEGGDPRRERAFRHIARADPRRLSAVLSRRPPPTCAPCWAGLPPTPPAARRPLTGAGPTATAAW